MRTFLIVAAFLAVFLGFCAYRLPQIPAEFQYLESFGTPIQAPDKYLEYWLFFVSNLTVSGSAASGVWLLTRK